jgi:hypothetical protein
MRPKGKLFALVALFAAVGLITATGAFTTVEAERTATVDVAGDSAALLGIEASSNIDEGAGSQTDGVFQLNLDDAVGNSDAQGLNPDANTTLTPLVNVTNQGSNDVDVTISATTEQGDVIVVDSDANGYTSTTLTPGDTVQFGLVIDLVDVDQGDASNFNITISIEANQSP